MHWARRWLSRAFPGLSWLLQGMDWEVSGHCPVSLSAQRNVCHWKKTGTKVWELNKKRRVAVTLLMVQPLLQSCRPFKYLFFLLDRLSGFGDLSSPTWDWTWAFSSERTLISWWEAICWWIVFHMVQELLTVPIFHAPWFLDSAVKHKEETIHLHIIFLSS